MPPPNRRPPPGRPGRPAPGRACRREPRPRAGGGAPTVPRLAPERWPDTSFYVPRYRVLIDGRELHASGSDFLSVEVSDSISELSGFTLVLNNWDDGGGRRRPGFKYTEDFAAVRPGSRVEIEMGYEDGPPMELMLTGVITALDPSFPASGAPTITVRGFDRLHEMRNDPKSVSWKDNDADIATAIAASYGMRARVDRTLDTGERLPAPDGVVPQQNMDDLAFLVERARRINFEVYACCDELCFVQSREGQDPVALRLEWGSSLVSFSPSLSFAKQVSEVTVRAWHPYSGELIEVTERRLDAEEVPPGRRPADDLVRELFRRDKREIITSEGVLSEADAKALAHSVLARSTDPFVTGTAQTVGIPLLRAGRNVELTGLGKIFDGKYYITESTHTIDEGGYQTTIHVRKAYV
ncbi:phage late control D family protein [Sorangium sp. So ce861]|uniref:phage late control D family protein n=1 Tax=Sorangium sp. So ce861 TaxID=3133323 RepID=UPI003F635571